MVVVSLLSLYLSRKLTNSAFFIFCSFQISFTKQLAFVVGGLLASFYYYIILYYIIWFLLIFLFIWYYSIIYYLYINTPNLKFHKHFHFHVIITNTTQHIRLSLSFIQREIPHSLSFANKKKRK
jgi:hypothetical protein